MKPLAVQFALLSTFSPCLLIPAAAQGITTAPPSALAVPAADVFSLGVALGEARYHARESSPSGGTLNTEDGRLPTLTVAGAWQRGPWHVSASQLLARQDLAYQGYTQIGIPLNTTTRLALGNTSLLAGYAWKVSDQGRLRVSGGLEHLRIDRQIQPALGSLPLHETLSLLRGVAGLQWAHGGELGMHWAAGLDWLHSVRSRLAVDTYGLYDPITLQPGRSNDWRAHVQASYRWHSGWTGKLMLSTESIRPGASAQEVWTQQGVPAVSVRYPGSRQSLTTLQAGLSWQF